MRQVSLTALLLLACTADPNALKGVHYFCDIAATSGTLQKVGGGISLTDKTGREEWCALIPANVTMLCQQACQNGVLTMSGTACNRVVGEASGTSEFVVWDSDLRAGKNLCAGGLVQGPGTPGCKPSPGQCANPNDTQYTCLYTNSPAPCDPFTAAQSPALGTQAADVVSYRATLSPSASVHITSDEDVSKNGNIQASPGARSLSFDLDSTGSNLYVTTLVLPFKSFTFNNTIYDKGIVYLVAPVAAGLVGPSTYAIPVGRGQFEIIASDQNSTGYSTKATNSAALTISLAANDDGPQLSGTVKGTFDGHSVHGDLANAPLVWLNRPPVAIAKVTNVVFNSSKWIKAKDNVFSCFANGKLRRFVWHGVEGAKVYVTLDGSDSFDPDAGDEIQFSWNSVPLGTQDTAYALLGAGKHHALLTVQDQYNVATVADVQFNVVDTAFNKPSDCGPPVIGLIDPRAIHGRVDLRDPLPFFNRVVAGVERSAGPGLVFNSRTVSEVKSLAAVGGKEFSERFMGQLQTRRLGSGKLRSAPGDRLHFSPMVRGVVAKTLGKE